MHENELEIYNALHENRFCFYLQPKVDLTNGLIIGAEALARRIGDDGTVIPPDKFMDLMEAKGSVIELDQIICRQEAKHLIDQLRAYGHHVSIDDLKDGKFIGTVQGIPRQEASGQADLTGVRITYP